VGEPMTPEERVLDFLKRECGLANDVELPIPGWHDLGCDEVVSLIAAAEDAAREEERADWAHQLPIAGPIPHRLSLLVKELNEAWLTKLADALGLTEAERVRECVHAHPLKYGGGCMTCGGSGTTPLTLPELVAVVRAKERERLLSEKEQ